ncbi:MAG: hypothetical protein A2511_01970 [Deltaproteobacteria bacterium RIFOXYD12_FULL_50_9]|nr:MAG: hypothetical protein A2511_01970 [Deltaproteobacteria bacterium RIFOXYD12_FULL_50_9]
MTLIDSSPKKRRSIRLHGYNYSQNGAYFVTICAQNRECLFGEIVDGEMWLNDAGRVVQKCWDDILVHFPYVEMDECVVMPNHVHGIIAIVGARHAVPLQTGQFDKPVAGSIPTIIRSFKSAVTKCVNEKRQISKNVF